MDALAQASGTDNYYRTLLKSVVYTDGVRIMAERGGAHWLIDAVMSHQATARRNPRLREIQFWKLEVREDGAATLYCCEDTPSLRTAKIVQEIPYTDFPLEEVLLYVALADENLWVIMLPTEY